MIAAGAALYLAYHRDSSVSPAPTGASTAAPLPDIAAPSGWTAQRVGPDRIDFVRQGATLLSSARIEVDASTDTSYLDTLNFPFSPERTWSSLNGSLILRTDTREDNGTSLTYLILKGDRLYLFTLLPYQFENPTTRAVVTPNPGDLPAIQAMVLNFAAGLK